MTVKGVPCRRTHPSGDGAGIWAPDGLKARLTTPASITVSVGGGMGTATATTTGEDRFERFERFERLERLERLERQRRRSRGERERTREGMNWRRVTREQMRKKKVSRNFISAQCHTTPTNIFRSLSLSFAMPSFLPSKTKAGTMASSPPFLRSSFPFSSSSSSFFSPLSFPFVLGARRAFQRWKRTKVEKNPSLNCSDSCIASAFLIAENTHLRVLSSACGYLICVLLRSSECDYSSMHRQLHRKPSNNVLFNRDVDCSLQVQSLIARSFDLCHDTSAIAAGSQLRTSVVHDNLLATFLLCAMS
ncbi:hypothetical protein H6P81_016504 [Aristolochia fimbriata]|uniref:Uncharacterized protein n=1 Tax=Aristolochia fimbriata TaxID=158543 RepID=A0AAV7EA60_ARIFI|nr:hypothetical protein H6P81_016504 [Aristolochia fimbriata]